MTFSQSTLKILLNIRIAIKNCLSTQKVLIKHIRTYEKGIEGGQRKHESKTTT